ncbi:MAG: histidine kinase, partial [Bacteroidota bacterium]
MKTFLRHALLWIVIYVVYTYMMSFYDDLWGRAVSNLVNVPLFMVAYYLLKYVQIPLLYNKGKMVAFGLSIAASAFVIGAFCRLNGIWWMDEFFGKAEQDIPFMTMGAYLLKTVRYYTPAMAILAWESHQERRKELERMHLLEKEKIATELKFLKAQINPHFLFNTLNNLYSYVVTNSPKAPDMILRLSSILDYVLYKSQQANVPLQEEVETIGHFLELEQIRYGDRLKVAFEAEGNMTNPVSPLILLSLVENAFK